MSEAQPSEVVTQGSSAAAVAARDVPWSENVAAAEAKLAALEAEGKGPAEPSRRTRTGRDDAGRFKAAGKDAPTAENATTEPEATEAEADKGEKAEDKADADDADDKRPVEVAERVKFRKEKREWRERLQAARSELTEYVRAVEKREADLAATAKGLEDFATAKGKKDARGIIAAAGMTVAEFQKLLLADVKDPAARAREEVEQLRRELADRERKAQEQAQENARRAEFSRHVESAKATLARTYPGLEGVRNVPALVVAELAQDEDLSWDEAVERVVGREMRSRFKAGGKPAPTPPDADPPRPARRAITPGTARAASVEPARRAMTQAERDQAWEREWAKKLAQTMR